MEITLELVERLKEKADVSYTQAKEALEYSGGNLLDALIYLEEKGAIPRAEGAYYSTRSETPPRPLPQSPSPPSSPPERKRPTGRAVPRGTVASGFLTACAAGLSTTNWRSGGAASPSPPCQC